MTNPVAVLMFVVYFVCLDLKESLAGRGKNREK